MTPSLALLALKLALVAATIFIATITVRRHGHAVSGALAGLPVIVGPIMAILLIDQPAERVRSIALATLACEPAMLAHILVFAHAARRFKWPACLAMSMAAYAAAAAGLSALPWSPLWATLAVAAALALAGHLMPATGVAADAPVSVPNSELWWRLAVAITVAASVMWGAGHFPAAIAGALLALPIAGSVLPCFTLPRHGADATARLLAGFVRGQSGFVAFFVVLVALLGQAPKALAFSAAVGAALAVPWALRLGRLRVAQRASA